MRDIPSRTRGAIGLLDIGSAKVAALIAAPAPAPTGQAAAGAGLKVLGIGYGRSKGLKAGVITDLDAAEEAVRSAVSQAERIAGVTLGEVFVSVSCGRLRSSHFCASAAVDSGVVAARDLDRVLAAAHGYAGRDGRVPVQLVRLGWKLDAAAGIRDPRGMAGNTLCAEIHAVTADDAPLKNLSLLIERCHLSVAGLVPAGVASALAATTPEERRLGVTCIDLGAGVATIAMFHDGRFLFTDTLPVGGNHLSYDLSRQLETPLAQAERIKVLYGTLTEAASDEQETVSYPLAAEGDPQLYQTSKAAIRRILRPRMDVILGLVRERVEASGLARLSGARVVLTGGASGLVGLAEVAADRFAAPVRIARPAPIGGVPSSVCSPQFSCALGLVAAAGQGDLGLAYGRERSVLGPSMLGRVGQWLREGF